MDRSFLSQQSVIDASRKFVCIRLATYESEGEAAFLKSMAAGRSGELENTVFCFLAPNGENKLTRAARGARQRFANAEDMAEAMTTMAAKFPGRGLPSALPIVASLRLAIDVAAADNRPLLIIRAKNLIERSAIEQVVANLVWQNEFVGRFVIAVVKSDEELRAIEGVHTSSQIAVALPDKFGLKATVVRQCAAIDAPMIEVTLKSSLKAFSRDAASQSSHIRDGRRAGVFWETMTPVTDPEEKRARERGRP